MLCYLSKNSLLRVPALLICIAFFVLFCACPDSPVYAKNSRTNISVSPGELDKVERKLDMERKAKDDMEKTVARLERELKSTKAEVMGVATRIRENERRINALEAEILRQKKRQDEIRSRIEREKGSVGELLLAVHRMKVLPTEALMVRPGTPMQTAQSAMLLEGIVPGIVSRVERMGRDLKDLDEIVTTLKDDVAEFEKLSAKLEKEREELSLIAEKRKRLLTKTIHDYERQEDRIRKIALKAKNLKELIRKIEEEQKKAKKEMQERARKMAQLAKTRKEKERIKTIRYSQIPKQGEARPPVLGKVKVAFGQTNNVGIKNMGMTIEGRKNALVVSPMGGIVRYSSKFKGYGNLVIIKHRNGYHSLIAGLGKINAVVGQTVEAGDPIGVMGNKDGQLLYYELRYNGKPVNPSKKLGKTG